MPEPTPPASPPAPDLSGINATIEKLNSTLTEITDRIDIMEGQIVTPPAPATPPKEGEEDWKPSKWSDIPKKSEEIAEEVIDRKLKEKEDEADAVRQADDAKQKAIDDEFDRQLTDLETNNRIPKVKNPNDENDPGRVARRELFGLGVHYDSANLMKMADLREQFNKQGLKYDSKAKSFVRGDAAPTYSQNAPVAGTNKSGTSEAKPTYKDIHSKSFDQLRNEYLGEE